MFHENSITVGWYSGAPYTFNFAQNRIKGIGCAVPGSLISIGPLAFFWGEDDIYSFDGQNVEPLGLGVKETVLGSMGPGVY